MRSAHWLIFGLFVSAAACQTQAYSASIDLQAMAKPSSEVTRFIAYGDWGGGTSGQLQLAKQMSVHHRQNPFQFALLLGDNFYPSGVRDEHDPLWKSYFETPYAALLKNGVLFYGILGNHDVRTRDGVGQLAYAKKNPQWMMPSRYYRFTKGAVECFGIDGNVGHFDATQKKWLEQSLAASKSPWKIVYGHFPVFTNGHYIDDKRMQQELKPILEKHKVDFYLNGHDHNMQVFPPINGVRYVVSGAGGAYLYPLKKESGTDFQASTFGFFSFTADEKLIELQAIDRTGQVLYRSQMTKSVPRVLSSHS